MMRTPASLTCRPRRWLFSLVFALVLGITGPLAAALESAPVVLAGETLFPIQAGVGSFDPGFRAEVISERIDTLARDLSIPLEAIEVVDNPKAGSTDIRVAGTTLVTMVDAVADAAAAGMARDVLAETYALRIREASADFR